MLIEIKIQAETQSNSRLLQSRYGLLGWWHQRKAASAPNVLQAKIIYLRVWLQSLPLP